MKSTKDDLGSAREENSTTLVVSTVDEAVVKDSAKASMNKRTVWIDIDNSPHVPFFLPIIGELQSRGIELL